MVDDSANQKLVETPVEIPPVVAPASPTWFSRITSFGSPEQDDRNQIERDGSQTHNIRRWASYGSLFLILLMYGFGAFVIALFLGLVPTYPAIDSDKWHIVATILAALFTVPTVILLAVMRSTMPIQRDEELPKSMHEALGQAISRLFDKIVDSNR